jgi:hypothetical protein
LEVLGDGLAQQGCGAAAGCAKHWLEGRARCEDRRPVGIARQGREIAMSDPAGTRAIAEQASQPRRLSPRRRRYCGGNAAGGRAAGKTHDVTPRDGAGT